VYGQECGLCHGSGAADRAEIGRLADQLYRSEPDGAPLVDFLLRGRPDDEHPPFDHLTDERVAALIAYLLAYGDADVASGARPVITAQDVAARRTGR
jgi:mono/diheme cytochrome c family protein